MYTNYYKQIWSKQFYFQLWKTEIRPHVFHRWSWQQTVWYIHIPCCAVLSRSAASDSSIPHGLQLTRLLCPWGFSRQEHWSRLPCHPTGHLPNVGIEPRSPAFQVNSLVWATREAQEYWSRLPIPSPGDAPDPGIELGSLALQAGGIYIPWNISQH